MDRSFLRQNLRVFLGVDSVVLSANDSGLWQKDFAFDGAILLLREVFQWSQRLPEKWLVSNWAMNG
jgi:hypothetical protein